MLVEEALKEILVDKIEITPDEFNPEAKLADDFGVDSTELVEVCLALEDIANERGFEFDWTSDSAMSKLRSMFRTVGSLTEEFYQQSSKRP